MSQYLETNKIEIIAEPGSSLASAIETKEVKLDNYQSAQIVISTGEGDTATTKASVVAILPDATIPQVTVVLATASTLILMLVAS